MERVRRLPRVDIVSRQRTLGTLVMLGKWKRKKRNMVRDGKLDDLQPLRAIRTQVVRASKVTITIVAQSGGAHSACLF